MSSPPTDAALVAAARIDGADATIRGEGGGTGGGKRDRDGNERQRHDVTILHIEA